MPRAESSIRYADRSNPEDLQQILDISSQWRQQFVPDAVEAIGADYGRFPCLICEVDGRIEAFVIFIPAHLELELLWGAARIDSWRRAVYIKELILRVESEFFVEKPQCLVSVVKLAAPDASLPDDTVFTGQASTGIRSLLTKLGYDLTYRLESYWKPGDHCLLAVKRKNQVR